MAAEPAEDHGPPNIVFILRMIWAGATRALRHHASYETPNIERLAKRGMLFTQAYAHPCVAHRGQHHDRPLAGPAGMTVAACHVETCGCRPAEAHGDALAKAASPWGAPGWTRISDAGQACMRPATPPGISASGTWAASPTILCTAGSTWIFPTPRPTQPGCYYAPLELARRLQIRPANPANTSTTAWPTRPSASSGPIAAALLLQLLDVLAARRTAGQAEPGGKIYAARSPRCLPIIRSATPIRPGWSKSWTGRGSAGGRLDELRIADRTIIFFSSDNGGWNWPSGRRRT